jgi:L-seryl-tRNA(Ser) seleniumtransferase
MANRSGFQRASRSTIVLRSRLRDLTSRVRTNPAMQRVGKWFDGLQADLRGAAKERIHEAGTLAGRVARQLLAPTQSGTRAIVNATGILNLTGAELPLADAAIDELTLVARDYRAFAGRPCGSSADAIGDAALRSVETLVAELTGAEAALVFANPAAAMVAILSALAEGREVLAARSQIERLHGDFSLPAAVDLARARLREIGTTHRATREDFRAATSADSAVILHSQPAEYRIAGSVAEAALDELVQLASQRQIPLVASLPSATLIPLPFAGAGRLPIVGQSIIAGADLVIFHGDTCVGGPACAIVAGRRDLIGRIAEMPLAAILSADSCTLAALAATLRLHTTPELAMRSIPLVQLLAASSDNLKHRAERLAPQIRHSSLVARVDVMPCEAWLSEARIPDERLSSWCLRVEPRGTSAARLADDMADRMPGVWMSTEDNYLLINLRSVLARQDEQIASAFQRAGVRTADTPASGEAAIATTTDILSSAE